MLNKRRVLACVVAITLAAGALAGLSGCANKNAEKLKAANAKMAEATKLLDDAQADKAVESAKNQAELKKAAAGAQMKLAAVQEGLDEAKAAFKELGPESEAGKEYQAAIDELKAGLKSADDLYAAMADPESLTDKKVEEFENAATEHFDKAGELAAKGDALVEEGKY